MARNPTIAPVEKSAPRLRFHHVGIAVRSIEESLAFYSGLLFRLMAAGQKQALFGNTARAMGDAPREVKLRHIGNCLKADPAYGEGVARALGIPMSEVPKNG